MDLQLSGMKAVVTGGSAGIGAAIVRVLAQEGCDVMFCARRQPGIEKILADVRNVRGKVEAARIDVLDVASVKAWFADIGAFDIFIPNVSALSDNWKNTVTLDIQTTVETTEAALPHMYASEHAAITYIGSKAGSLACPGSPAYGAGKAAMAHYMKSLSARLLPKVRVNTVSPGDTLAEGGIWDQVRIDDPDAYEKIISRNPLQRLATAEEIARVVAFVSSPAASFVAGANWYVDGGATSHVQL